MYGIFVKKYNLFFYSSIFEYLYTVIPKHTIMGYEIKLIIGTTSSGMKDEGADYMSIIATIDLCKIGEGHLSLLDSYIKADESDKKITGNMKSIKELKALCKQKNITNSGTGQMAGELFLDDEIRETKVYVYSPFGGDDQVFKDFYDKDLIAVPVGLVYECIKHDNQSSPYRRYDAALGLLESFLDENKWGDDIMVVLFGH
jgi:hypothetical protein